MTDTEVPFVVHEAHDPTPEVEDRVRTRVVTAARRRRRTRRAVVAVPVLGALVAVGVLVATRGTSDDDIVLVEPPPPGLSVAPNVAWDHATLEADGRTLVLMVGSYPPGDGPCTQTFVHDVVETDTAVTIGVEEVEDPPADPPTSAVCAQAAQSQPIEVTLQAPLGDRPVLDGVRPAPRTILRMDALVQVTHVPDGFAVTASDLSLPNEPSQQTFEAAGADWYFAVNQVSADAAADLYGAEQGTPVAVGDITGERVTGQMNGTMETIRFPLGDLVVSVWGEMQGPPSFTHTDELLRIAEGIRPPARR